jgi:hypothetical protein
MLVTLENFAIIAKIQNKKLMYYYLHKSVQFRKRITELYFVMSRFFVRSEDRCKYGLTKCFKLV